LSLPALGLQRVIDRFIAARHKEQPGSNDSSLASGTWLTLGAGTFFSAMSSKSEAIKRLTRTRCNVLLSIQPDDRHPCFAKQMSLRGASVDDVIFPLGALFRITRITRIVSSDLDAEVAGRANPSEHSMSSVRWPIMVFELASANRFLEVLKTLEPRGGLDADELETHLKAWIDGLAPNAACARLLESGELLTEMCARASTKGSGSAGGRSLSTHANEQRYATATEFLERAAAMAESERDSDCQARALLSLARCQIDAGKKEADQLAPEAKKAISMVAIAHGADHPETCAARSEWRKLGVSVRNHTARE